MAGGRRRNGFGPRWAGGCVLDDEAVGDTALAGVMVLAHSDVFHTTLPFYLFPHLAGAFLISSHRFPMYGNLKTTGFMSTIFSPHSRPKCLTCSQTYFTRGSRSRND